MVPPGRRIEKEGSWYNRFPRRIPEEAFVAALTAAVGLLLLGLIGEVLLTFLAYLPLIIAITLIATAALVFGKVYKRRPGRYHRS